MELCGILNAWRFPRPFQNNMDVLGENSNENSMDEDVKEMKSGKDSEPEIQIISLFPAYGSHTYVPCPPLPPVKTESSNLEWLSNSSFQVPVDVLQNQIQPVTSEPEDRKLEYGQVQHVKDRRKHKKKHKESRETRPASLKQVIKTVKDEHESDETIYGLLAKKVFLEDTGLALERAYRVDKKPDRNNLAFKTFYHQHIAKYFLKHCPFMGISPELERLWYLEQSKKRRSGKKDRGRYFSKEYVLNVQKLSSQIIASNLEEKSTKSQKPSGYLPLETSFKRSNLEERNPENPLGIYDSATELYLQGKGQEMSDDLPVVQTPWQQEIRQKTLEFNKLLRENPDNEDTWLAFVDFQDQVMSLDPYAHFRTMGKSRDTTCMEKKLAILERAVQENPQSVRLPMALLKVCEGLWETDKVLAEWKRLCFKHPNQPIAWLGYLLFVQSNLTYFTVAKATKVYIKCLNTLSNILEGTFQSHSPPPDLEEKMLEIFYQYCHMLKESGYSERSLATFQALIELNLFTPSPLREDEDLPLSEWLAFFEPFWDSCVARFGEEGAQGWRKVMNDRVSKPGASVGFGDLESAEDEIIKKRLSKWGTWLQFELLRQENHWLPWRADIQKGEAEDGCEDPERMVVVDDVVSLLFRLKSEKSKFSLFLHFLRLLDVQTHLHRHTSCRNSACMNQATVTELSSVTSYLTSKSTAKKNEIGDVLLLPTVVKRHTLSLFVLRVLSQAQQCFTEYYRKKLVLMWVEHGLDTAIESGGGNKKKLKLELKDLKKNTKNLLRDEANRNDLDLWALYSKIDWLLDNAEEVHRVFETTLTVHGFEGSNKDIVFRFTKQYVDLLLGNDRYVSSAGLVSNNVDEQRALWVLASLGSGDKYCAFKGQEIGSVQLLKARKGFETLFILQMDSVLGNDEDVESDGQQVLTNCIECYANFFYFSQGLPAAKNVYERALEELKNRYMHSSSISEEIYTSYLKLLSYHVTHRVSPLSTIRSTLENALLIFPCNPEFLELLLDLEGGAYIAGRLRRYVGRVMRMVSALNPVFWYSIVCGELRRLKTMQKFISDDGDNCTVIPETGTTWKVRSLLETAVTNNSTQHCPLLWRMYMKFENDYGDENRVKSIFYRALRNCPWTKVLYMDALFYMPEDLQEILDLMGEKELRVRTLIEEVELLMQEEQKSQDDAAKGTTEMEIIDAS